MPQGAIYLPIVHGHKNKVATKANRNKLPHAILNKKLKA